MHCVNSASVSLLLSENKFMKILKEGKLLDEMCPKYRGTCKRCKCEVEADYCDLIFNGVEERVYCPTKFCFNKILVTKYITRE